VVAVYVIHVLDESLLGESFVEKVRAHWWPQYSWQKFFWFNTGYFVIMIASVIAYDFDPSGSANLAEILGGTLDSSV
jgi:hypothetical protein